MENSFQSTTNIIKKPSDCQMYHKKTKDYFSSLFHSKLFKEINKSSSLNDTQKNLIENALFYKPRKLLGTLSKKCIIQKKLDSNDAVFNRSKYKLEKNLNSLQKLYKNYDIKSSNNSCDKIKNIKKENKNFYDNYQNLQEQKKNKNSTNEAIQDIMERYKSQNRKCPKLSSKNNIFAETPLIIDNSFRIKNFFLYTNKKKKNNSTKFLFKIDKLTQNKIMSGLKHYNNSFYMEEMEREKREEKLKEMSEKKKKFEIQKEEKEIEKLEDTFRNINKIDKLYKSSTDIKKDICDLSKDEKNEDKKDIIKNEYKNKLSRFKEGERVREMKSQNKKDIVYLKEQIKALNNKFNNSCSTGFNSETSRFGNSSFRKKKKLCRMNSQNNISKYNELKNLYSPSNLSYLTNFKSLNSSMINISNCGTKRKYSAPLNLENLNNEDSLLNNKKNLKININLVKNSNSTLYPLSTSRRKLFSNREPIIKGRRNSVNIEISHLSSPMQNNNLMSPSSLCSSPSTIKFVNIKNEEALFNRCKIASDIKNKSSINFSNDSYFYQDSKNLREEERLNFIYLEKLYKDAVNMDFHNPVNFDHIKKYFRDIRYPIKYTGDNITNFYQLFEKIKGIIDSNNLLYDIFMLSTDKNNNNKFCFNDQQMNQLKINDKLKTRFLKNELNYKSLIYKGKVKKG